MAISGVVGAIYKASGTSAAFSQKPLTNTGDHKTYYVTDRNVAYWDQTAVLTLEKSVNGGTNWTAVTSGFEIQHAGGYIVFAVSQTATPIFRVTGKNFTPVAVGGGYNWSVDIEADTLEANTFLNNGWKSFIPSVKGFTGSFDTYWQDGNVSLADLNNVNMIVVLYTDVTAGIKNRYEGYASFTKFGMNTPNDNLVTQSIEFKGGGKLFYRVG
jgi:hypothetical protein